MLEEALAQEEVKGYAEQLMQQRHPHQAPPARSRVQPMKEPVPPSLGALSGTYCQRYTQTARTAGMPIAWSTTLSYCLRVSPTDDTRSVNPQEEGDDQAIYLLRCVAGTLLCFRYHSLCFSVGAGACATGCSPLFTISTSFYTGHYPPLLS